MDLVRRRALLIAATGFMRIRWGDPRPPVVDALTRWLDTWSGVGAIVTGMKAQGFNLELREFPSGWRANFYPVGTAHSVVVGSGWQTTPWAAVRQAAWESLQH